MASTTRASRAHLNEVQRPDRPRSVAVARTDFWGKRRFAYEINHKTEGFYVVARDRDRGGGLDAVERSLRSRTHVVRHKLIRLPDDEAARRGLLEAGRAGRRPAEHGGTTMANGNTITLVGNLTRDPELRYTTSARPRPRFGLAVNRRWQNRQSSEWEEQTSFFNVVCWREMAENVSESLQQGHARHRHRPPRAALLGDPGRREARSVVEIVADEIGPSLRWATAEVTRNERRGGDGGGGGGGGGRRRRWRRRRRRLGGGSRPAAAGADDDLVPDEEPF